MKTKSFLVPGMISLFLLAGCGGDSDSSSPDRTQQEEREDREEEVYLPSDFDTRISNNLAISGDECEGGEMTNHPDRPDETCEEGQWLLTIDDVNTCTDDGACTEVFVFPIVGNLYKVEDNPPEYSLYEMKAISPVNQERREILDSYRVKASPRETVVVPK